MSPLFAEEFRGKIGDEVAVVHVLEVIMASETEKVNKNFVPIHSKKYLG